MSLEVWACLAMAVSGLLVVVVRQLVRRHQRVSLDTFLLATVLNTKYVVRR